MLNEFISYLNEQAANDSIYVWGAQGQKWPTLTAEWIKSKETNLIYRRDALKMYEKACRAGHERDCRAFDCSGLGMYWLYNVKKIYKSDMTANGMKGKCSAVSKCDIRPGDWVFRVYKTGANKGRAYHIGYVVDDALNVIEAKGRAYGVAKRPFDSSYWNAYGRPECFRDEIEKEPAPATVFIRVLKKGRKGADVKELQRLLNKSDGAGLAVDGDFGNKTLAAVKAYQKLAGLKADGLAGRYTITALGGDWRG